jgi:hypothetical protein
VRLGLQSPLGHFRYNHPIAFRLIGSPEEWHSIAESVKSCADYRVLRDGVLFTVLQPSEDWAQD